jgi:hypothetical protein
MAGGKRRRGLPKKSAFLAAYVRTASITKAARAARLERQLHYRWLADDPDYPKQFEAAQREAAQILEDEAIRRAHEGIVKPLTYKGQFSYKTRPKKTRMVRSSLRTAKRFMRNTGRLSPFASTRME